MAGERDRLQALAFERRRTRAAFVRGPSGERAGDLVSPARWIVGSLVLGLVLLLAAAASGLIGGRTSVRWDDHGPVISHHRPRATPSPDPTGPP